MANEERPTGEQRGPDEPDRWQVYRGTSGGFTEPEPEPTATTTRPTATTTGATRADHSHSVRLVLAGVVVAVVVVSGVILYVVLAALGGAGGIGGPDEPQTAAGFTEMVADLEEETGSTRVFDATLYPEYGIVYAPYADDDRAVGYRWDGGIEEWTKTTSSYATFDLADIDPEVVDGLCDDVVELVDDPRDCYIIIRKPDPQADSEAWFAAYVSNEFNQSARITYDADGNELERWEP